MKEKNRMAGNLVIYCLKTRIVTSLNTHYIFNFYLALCHSVTFPSSSVCRNFHYSLRRSKSNDILQVSFPPDYCHSFKENQFCEVLFALKSSVSLNLA